MLLFWLALSWRTFFAFLLQTIVFVFRCHSPCFWPVSATIFRPIFPVRFHVRLLAFRNRNSFSVEFERNHCM